MRYQSNLQVLSVGLEPKSMMLRTWTLPNARIIIDNTDNLDYFRGIGTATVQENSNYPAKYYYISIQQWALHNYAGHVGTIKIKLKCLLILSHTP